MTRAILTTAGIALALTLTACGGAPRGPHVRMAHASATEIEAAQATNGPVFYDFEPGDRVPILLGVMGLFEAFAEPAPTLIARRQFSVVIYPNGNTFFSIEGGRLMSANALARWGLAFEGTPSGGQAALVLLVGRAEDMPEGAPAPGR